MLANIDLFLAQSDEDRNRLIAIGADEKRVQISGNLKFDVQAPPDLPIVEQLRAAIAPGAHVIVAGSTVEGEEELLLPAIRTLLRFEPKAVIIVAPRHPERFEAVAKLLQSSFVSFSKRSTWSGYPLQGSVLLLDTIGELAAIYRLATLAFVGGSLVPSGGHNILEPAQFGKAILVGPHTENFRDIVEIFRRAHAVRVVSSQELEQKGWPLLDDDTTRNALGERARQVFESQTGARERTMDALKVLLWMPETLNAKYRSNSNEVAD